MTLPLQIQASVLMSKSVEGQIFYLICLNDRPTVISLLGPLVLVLFYV